MTMARIPLTKEDADFIAHRIAAFTQEPAEKLSWLLPYVSAFRALPLYVGWTETYGLRADGELVRWSTEDEYQGTLALDDRLGVRFVLVEGAERYPELQHLIPARPPNASTCPTCAGTGRVPPAANLRCGSCGGVGWVDPDHPA
jgi:hypothetical protein